MTTIQPRPAGQPRPVGSRRLVSAGTITGNPVRNLSGEDLGKIEEIMLDSASGRIAYAVLSFGGFLGMGDKLFAVPWAALSLNDDRDGFILNVDQGVMEEAPGFDKDEWPDFADPTWGRSIHAHYNATPYWDR
ncbi:MAG: PRC-barrel domain containing protein [Gemmatimonadales bacterium]|nr:MAG: PRC-barrel domain containing protein [Gemmatimonadales bacterium]